MAVHLRRRRQPVDRNCLGCDDEFPDVDVQAVGQITSTGYRYDGVGNLVAAPGQTFTYNGAQQLTASTKGGVETVYEYAGADMNKLL